VTRRRRRALGRTAAPGLLVLAACTARLADPTASPAARSEEERVEAGTRPPDTPGTDAPNRGSAPPPNELVPLDPVVRRLTKDELIHTVEDLFGLALSAADRALLPEDRPLEGFVNIATGQSALPPHVRGIAQLAARVAASDAAGRFIARLGSCPPSLACGRTFVERAGAVVFRRPPAEETVERYATVFAAAADEGLDFERSARWTLRALLQAPEFLYRIERETDGSGTRIVGGYEMATRLSYLIWASAPDEALLAAAARGELDDAEGVRGRAERLLSNTDRVNRVLDRFLLDWSGLESIPNDDGSKTDLQRTAIRFYEDFVGGGGDLFEIFTAPTAHLTPQLARSYGLESRGDGIRAYDLSEVGGRGGLLGQPGVLAGMTNADGGAIVARGLFLQRQLFCGQTPDPPASLQERIDAFTAEQPSDASDRQIAEARMLRGECAACHAAFDPLAYGFEKFDHRGAYRLADEHGNPLRDDGWIPGRLTGGEDVAYAGFDDYMRALEDAEEVKRCFVQRQLEYALGHRLGEGQAAAIDDLVAAVEASGGTYTDFIRALVVHDVFRTAGVPEEEEG